MAPVTSRPPFVKILIVGGGFSGLTIGCQLRRKLNCDDFVIYDQGASPGGTWWANQYPGCGVDIPAVFYSLSFALNPNFSEFFPKQAEILNYFRGVADKFNVSDHIVCNVRWESAYWREDTKTWLVTLKDLATGESFQQECKLLISAVGGLSIPNACNIPGADTFKGDIMHTATWNNAVSLKDKNVVVVGNGSSASQLVPSIAHEAKSITQFIRTPQHYMPKKDHSVHPRLKLAFTYIPGLLWIARMLVFLYFETMISLFSLTSSGAKLRKKYRAESQEYIKSTAPEKYWPLLTPDYEFGCKRRVYDNGGYTASLCRDNVHLTNDAIEVIGSNSVVTSTGKEYPADIIVLATGFALSQFDNTLVGRNGITREQHYKAYGTFEAFKTVAMAGFPNFFYLLGPHSGRGHTSTLLTIEIFTDLILRVAKPVIRNRASTVEVKLASEQGYHKKVYTALDQSIFSNDCHSWFIDQRTGRNWFIYPWNSFTMWCSAHVGGWNDWSYEKNHVIHEKVKSSFATDRIGISTLAVMLLLTGSILFQVRGLDATQLSTMYRQFVAELHE